MRLKMVFFFFLNSTFRLRLELLDAAPSVELAVTFLGMTGEEQYELNPYMDETKITHSE